MVVAGVKVALHAFHLVQSHWRFGAVVWMPAEYSLCWLPAQNAAFETGGWHSRRAARGNTQTAAVRSAGAWGQLYESTAVSLQR